MPHEATTTTGNPMPQALTRGACVGASWWPWADGDGFWSRAAVDRALATCDACPVRTACAGYATNVAPYPHGLWAGVDVARPGARAALAIVAGGGDAPDAAPVRFRRE